MRAVLIRSDPASDVVLGTVCRHNPNVKQVPSGIPVLGLIGGIGSGKSHVARHWATTGPAGLVEGDAAGHEVLENPDVRDEIRHHFGDAVFDPSGQVNRRAMARRVFGPEASHRQARRMLEAIVHPRIKALLAERIAAAKAVSGNKAVLVDAALLVEAGWKTLCDALVFIDVPWEARLERVQSRGWTEADLRAREASQLPLDIKRKEADHVLDNSSTTKPLPPLDSLLSQLFAVNHG